MSFRKFVIVNSILIGTIIIISGFVWLITDAILSTSFEITMAAFSYTLSGLIFWGIGYHYASQEITEKSGYKTDKKYTFMELNRSIKSS